LMDRTQGRKDMDKPYLFDIVDVSANGAFGKFLVLDSRSEFLFFHKVFPTNINFWVY
jgi:hypothetical protein